MTAELVRDTGKILGQVAFKMGPSRLTRCRLEERGPDSWTAFQEHGTGLEVGKHRCIPGCWQLCLDHWLSNVHLLNSGDPRGHFTNPWF